MVDAARCPLCGTTQPAHDTQCREEDLKQFGEATVRLARLLNGTPWRERVRWTDRATDFAPAD
jgi:hypothetical protein